MAYTFSSAVQAEQKALNLKGANLKTDGLLGPLTTAARTKYGTPTTATTLTEPTLPPATGLGGFTIDTSGVDTNMATTPAVKADAVDYYKRLQDALSSYNTNRKTYEDQLSGLLTPGADELVAQTSLKNINQGERQGLLNIENKAIPMEFITGQQSAVSKQATLDRLAASENLSALTGVRQTAVDAIKTKLGFEDTRFEKILGVESALQGLDKAEKTEARQTISDILDFSKGKSFAELDAGSQQAITNAVANSPYTLGQVQQALERNKVAYQDERNKAASEQAKALKESYMSVGKDSRIFNTTTGQYVGGGSSGGTGGGGFNGGGSTTVNGKTTNIGELKSIAGVLSSKFTQKFAQEAFNAQVNSFIKSGDTEGLGYYLRSTAAGQIPGAELKQKYIQNIEILKNIDRLSAIMTQLEEAGIDTNIFSGTAQSIKNKVGELGDPLLVDLAQQALNARDIIGRLRTGAALTNTEEKMYKKMTPSIFRTAELNKQILENLKTSIQSSTDSYLGLSISPKQSETLKKTESTSTSTIGKTTSGNSYQVTKQ